MSWNKKERRQFIRAHFPCELAVNTSEKNTIQTQTENISAGGIRVFTDKKLEPSTIISVIIHGISAKSIICKGRIMWAFERKHPQNESQILFDIGIEFHQITEDIIFKITKLIESLTADKK
ncbi:MAG: PilZ domain-containing protein [Candidatus Omnitrophota bacterium]|nr:PilZ domain-containing protein [Candidatus Omnitrophota bacterium]